MESAVVGAHCFRRDLTFLKGQDKCPDMVLQDLFQRRDIARAGQKTDEVANEPSIMEHGLRRLSVDAAGQKIVFQISGDFRIGQLVNARHASCLSF